ncbi:11517_t:CDS:2, partial [Diversispora eburnea]
VEQIWGVRIDKSTVTRILQTKEKWLSSNQINSIQNFKKCNGIQQIKLQGEAASANEIAIKEAIPLLQNKCAEYTCDWIYNMDETEPDYTLATRRLSALCLPNAMDVKEFLLMPEENIIYEVLEDDKIITELVNIFKNSDENNENTEESDDSIEPIIIDINTAFKSLENVQMFLLQQENSEKHKVVAVEVENTNDAAVINDDEYCTVDVGSAGAFRFDAL